MAGGLMDKVRFEAQQRGDIPDLLALQQLALDYDVAAQGGLLGLIGADEALALYAGGCLSQPTLTTSPNTVKLGAASFLQIEQPLTGKVTAQVVRTEGASVACGAPTDTPNTPWLWFRRLEPQGAAATRRKWATSKETVYSPNTRLMENVVFMAAATRPPTESLTSPKWYPFARVTGWDGNVPVVALLSAWDPARLEPNPGEAFSDAGPALFSNSQCEALRTLLYRMRVALGQQLDTDLGTAWYSAPVRGLKQLDADLAALAISATRDGSLIASGTVSYQAFGPTLAQSLDWRYVGSTFSVTYVASGNYLVTFTAPLALPSTLTNPHVIATIAEDPTTVSAFRRIHAQPVLNAPETALTALIVKVRDINGALIDLVEMTDFIGFHFTVFAG